MLGHGVLADATTWSYDVRDSAQYDASQWDDSEWGDVIRGGYDSDYSAERVSVADNNIHAVQPTSEGSGSPTTCRRRPTTQCSPRYATLRCLRFVSTSTHYRLTAGDVMVLATDWWRHGVGIYVIVLATDWWCHTSSVFALCTWTVVLCFVTN